VDGEALTGPVVGGAAREPAGAVGFPWPPRPGESVLVAAFETWRASVFRPARFFAALPAGRGFGAALAYALPVGTLGSGAALFWNVVFALAGLPAPFLPEPTALDAAVGFLLTPAFLLLWILLHGVATHAVLRLLGAGTAGLRATLQVLAYAAGPAVWAAVPVVGSLAAGVWSFVLAVVGLAAAHRTGRLRAAAALVLPPGLAAVLLVAALLLLFLTALLPVPTGAPPGR